MMRALKAAATLAVLGVLMGGQCTTSSPGTLSFAWKFIDKKQAPAGDFTAANNGCAMAYVDSVTVTLDGTDYAGYPCAAPSNAPNGTPGVDFADVPAGNHSYTVSAFRGSELVFQASGQVRSSGIRTPVDVTLSPGTNSSLPIFYKQNGSYSCAGTPSVTYQILDANNVPQDNGTLPCVAGSPILSTLFGTGGGYPFGPYWIHYLSLLNGPVAAYQVCCQAIDHEGFAQVVNLPVAGATCKLTCP